MSNGFVFTVNKDTGIPGKWIEDTDYERKKAKADGYNAFGIFNFSHIPSSSNCEPILNGNLWIEIKGINIYDIISCARNAIENLCTNFRGFRIETPAYFLNGAQSCQICIPSSAICDPCRHEKLNLIYRDMVLEMLRGYGRYTIFQPTSFNTIINMKLYDLDQMYTVQDTTIPLPNGQYRVQITPRMFMEGDIKEMIELTSKPYLEEECIPTAISTGLANLFHLSKMKMTIFQNMHDKIESLSMCKFVHHCYNILTGAKNLSYELISSDKKIMTFVGMLYRLGSKGLNAVKELFKHNENFKGDKLNSLLNIAKEYTISCSEVKKIYDCPDNCDVYCPFDLQAKEKNDVIEAETNFKLNPDGLYYISKDESDTTYRKISSYIKILGKIKNKDGNGWGRYVVVRDPDGKDHTLYVSMSDCVNAESKVISKLCDAGFEIVSKSDKKLIIDYIEKYQKDVTYTYTSKIGWQEDGVYILPDKVYGLNKNMNYCFTSDENIYNTSGSHEEWVEYVGKYCTNNPLMQFVCQLALSGCLLYPLEIDNGGYHFFGQSSSGKSTLAQLAGSICGGGGNAQKGFVNQWRTTDNRLEKTVLYSNDNFLDLDEVSQAKSEAVYNALYMLANGCSKGRMRPDSTPIPIETWKVNCLSTGEISLKDKINSDPRLKAMAGQEVRFIDIPVIHKGKNIIFQDLHGKNSPGELADYINENVRKYYGAPLRKFLEFIDDKENFKTIIDACRKYAVKFVNDNCSQEACGQVRRVARKLGEVAATGYLAVARNVLPWSAEAAYGCVKYVFDLYLDNRGTIGVIEIENAINSIVEYIESRKFIDFIRIDTDKSYVYNSKFSGVIFEDAVSHKDVYFINTVIFNKITHGVDKNSLLMELKKRNMLFMTKHGTYCRTKSVNKDDKKANIAGVGIIIN